MKDTTRDALTKAYDYFKKTKDLEEASVGLRLKLKQLLQDKTTQELLNIIKNSQSRLAKDEWIVLSFKERYSLYETIEEAETIIIKRTKTKS